MSDQIVTGIFQRAATNGHHRNRAARRAALVAISAAAAVALLTGCGNGRPGQPSQAVGDVLTRAVPPDIADLPLTDDTGHPTSLAAFRGKFVMLTDFLTLCQDVCPLTSTNFELIDRAITGAHLAGRVQLVELTVDPQRDTSARLHAYRQLFQAPTNWSLLTASPDTVSKIWKFFGAYYQRIPEDNPPAIDWWTGKPLTYDVDHSDVLAYLDPAGRWRFLIFGLPNTQGRPVPPAMTQFLSDLGRTHLNHPDAQAWTVPQALQPLSWLMGTTIHTQP